MAALQELIVEVRRLRKEYGVPEGQRVSIGVNANDSLEAAVRDQAAALERLARVDSVVFGAGEGLGAHAVLRDGSELFLPLEGVIDVARELERLRGEIERLEGQLEAARRKLENENFVSRAPKEVVDRERAKADGLREQVATLKAKAADLGGAA